MTYNEIRKDPAICTYITQADASLAALGFTEHSFAHVTMVAENAISCVAEGTGKSLDSLNSMQDGTVNLSRRKQMN